METTDKIKKTRAYDCEFTLLISLEYGCVQTLDHAKNYLVKWMKQRQEAGMPYLTGVMTAGDYVFLEDVAYAKGAGRVVPVVLFQGDASSLISQGLGDKQIEDILTDFACFCGLGLEFGPKWARITVDRESIFLQVK